jgi:hypothetical protein
MCCRVTLHVNDAELNVRIGKQTGCNGRQTAEVIMNNNQQAA